MNAMQLAVSNLLTSPSRPTAYNTCTVCGMHFIPSGFKTTTTMCSDVCREVHKTRVQMAKRKAAKSRWNKDAR